MPLPSVPPQSPSMRISATRVTVRSTRMNWRRRQLLERESSRWVLEGISNAQRYARTGPAASLRSSTWLFSAQLTLYLAAEQTWTFSRFFQTACVLTVRPPLGNVSGNAGKLTLSYSCCKLRHERWFERLFYGWRYIWLKQMNWFWIDEFLLKIVTWKLW